MSATLLISLTLTLYVHLIYIYFAENVVQVCMSSHFLLSVSGGETSGAGQTGFPQHTQEADRLSAGAAGRGRGEEVCQITLGKKKL